MSTGTCLCGEVRYRINGDISFMHHCHCSMCRKSHGSAFATLVNASSSDFQWISGQDKVVVYESSPGVRRAFCSTCGSVLPGTDSARSEVFVPAGTLDDDLGARPEAHVFVASKAPWYEIHDDLPRHDAYRSADGRPAIDGPERGAETKGATAGSCLCGRVGFEFIDQPFALVNCHCSRCRRGRSAAHASNLFIKPEQLRWLSGEDQVTVYDFPGAVRFGTNFCSICGSCVPRFSASAGRVNVPMGSLDTDPGMSPTLHIYVGSKAPWFEISDDLPQFEAEAT